MQVAVEQDFLRLLQELNVNLLLCRFNLQKGRRIHKSAENRNSSGGVQRQKKQNYRPKIVGRAVVCRCKCPVVAFVGHHL